MPSDAFPEQIDRPEPPPRRRPGERIIVRGIAVALALGLVGGLVMRPNLEDGQPTKQASARKAEIPREPEGLEIMVTPPREPVTPILPPAPTVTPQPVQPSLPAPRPVTTAPQPRVTAQPVRDPTPRQRARPSFNCRFARSPSERMICVDPNLAAADRRLARAYREAIDAGIPERVLRRQQDVWLGAREAAARYGPEDVSRVYEARIAELEGMSRYAR